MDKKIRPAARSAIPRGIAHMYKNIFEPLNFLFTRNPMRIAVTI